MTTPHPTQLAVSPALDTDRPALQRLWALFRHDMSVYSGALPDHDGRFRRDRLDAAFDSPGWLVYRISLGSSPVGLAVVRSIDTDERVLSSFFLVNGARRAGHGLTVARHILRQHPGAWAVAFQDANLPAAAFWRRVATDAAGAAWSEAHRAVPGRSDLPPDTWLRFSASGCPDLAR